MSGDINLCVAVFIEDELHLRLHSRGYLLIADVEPCMNLAASALRIGGLGCIQISNPILEVHAAAECCDNSVALAIIPDEPLNVQGSVDKCLDLQLESSIHQRN